MNYLAHAYLSFNESDILVGNMISDFVKGSSRYGYTVTVQKGIMLHRSIDHFTDTHPATKEAKEFFRPHYRLYSGPITDVLFDHFLARTCTEAELIIFSNKVYDTLERNAAVLPPMFAHVFTYMRNENWLFHYRSRAGIEKSLRGLVRRSSYLTESETAFRLFNTHYTALETCFNNFFPSVKNFAKEEMQKLLAS